MMAWRKGFIVGWLSGLVWLALCGSNVWAQLQTPKDHPDYARVPKEVAEELNFPPKPKAGQEVYGFRWAHFEGAASERWVLMGGKYTRRLRVDGNKNGKLENDDPIREKVFKHYYLPSTSVDLQDISEWTRDKIVNLQIPKEAQEARLGDFSYCIPLYSNNRASCTAYRGPLQVHADVQYACYADGFDALWLATQLKEAGIEKWEYIDEPAFQQEQQRALARCPTLAISIVRQMLAKWDPYFQEHLLPGRGFKGLYVSTEAHRLTTADLPPWLVLDGDYVNWVDPQNPSRVIERYHWKIYVACKPESNKPLGWAREQTRQRWASENSNAKHSYPVELPLADRVSRTLYRDKGENIDSINYCFGNVVGSVGAVLTGRPDLAPGKWINHLAQALMFKLQGGGVPRELWEEQAPDLPSLAAYRMVSINDMLLQAETVEYDYTTSRQRATKRDPAFRVTLGYAYPLKSNSLPIPLKYVQKAEWRDRAFTFNYRWTSGNREVSGTAQGTLSGDGRVLSKLHIHEIRTQRTEREGLWEVEKWETRLELEGTPLIGVGEMIMNANASRIVSFACSYYWDYNDFGKIKPRLMSRTTLVSEQPGRNKSDISFYR